MAPIYKWDECIARLAGLDLPAMAEVGVWRGGNAWRILECVRPLFMWLVDRWESPRAHMSYAHSGARHATLDQSVYDAVYAECMRRIRPYRDRCSVLRMPSVEAADRVLDASLDLVFIDADHSYSGVRSDISAWHPKVRPGGWLGGHDYDHPRYPGVARAVHECFGAARIETGADYTWWLRIE